MKLHNDIKEILLPFATVPRTQLVEDLLVIPDYYLNCCEELPGLSEILFDENHDTETLKALNLHDSAIFIDKHREGVREEARESWFSRRK